jgi:hypothetical protein
MAISYQPALMKVCLIEMQLDKVNENYQISRPYLRDMELWRPGRKLRVCRLAEPRSMAGYVMQHVASKAGNSTEGCNQSASYL